MAIHSFDDTYPAARFDGVPWTRVQVEDSVDGLTGWGVVLDQAITPDPTPESPTPIDLTVVSPYESAYFRFRFADADGNFSPYTNAVLSPATDTSLPGMRPSVQEVALLERTRTMEPGSTESGTFTATTRPSAQEVEGLIDQATNWITTQVPATIPATYYGRMRHLATLYAAVLVETSFFREQIDQGSVAVYRSLIDAGLGSLKADLEDSGLDAVARRPWAMLPILTDRVPVVPEPDSFLP